MIYRIADIFPRTGYRSPLLSYQALITVGAAELILLICCGSLPVAVPAWAVGTQFVIYAVTVTLLGRLMLTYSDGLPRRAFWFTAAWALMPGSLMAVYGPGYPTLITGAVTAILWAVTRHGRTTAGIAAAGIAAVAGVICAAASLMPDVYGYSMPDGLVAQIQAVRWDISREGIFPISGVPGLTFWQLTFQPAYGQLFLILAVGVVWVLWKQRRNPVAWTTVIVPGLITAYAVMGAASGWEWRLLPATPAIFLLVMALTRNLRFTLRPLP